MDKQNNTNVTGFFFVGEVEELSAQVPKCAKPKGITYRFYCNIYIILYLDNLEKSVVS